jgi:hypothetical protein
MQTLRRGAVLALGALMPDAIRYVLHEMRAIGKHKAFDWKTRAFRISANVAGADGHRSAFSGQCWNVYFRRAIE